MTYDHLLPIFFQDARVDYMSAFGTFPCSLAGGLGLTTQQVGIIMSFNGIIALFIQAVVFPIMAAWLGVWRLFILVIVGHPVVYFIVPYLAMLPQSLLYSGIYTCLTIRNFFSILAYPLFLILIKEASPSPAQLGKINGLAASTGAACRTIASPIAGLLYGIGVQMNLTALAWWASTLVAIVGALQIAFLKRQNKNTTLVRTPATCRLIPTEEPSRSTVVRISIKEADDHLDV